MKQLRTKSSSLDEKKYSEFISTIKQLHDSATTKMEKGIKLSKRIKDEYSSKDDKPTEKPTTPPQPGSGASTLVPKLWWQLAIAGIVLCYGKQILRTLQ